jgi:hypothetical protein
MGDSGVGCLLQERTVPGAAAAQFVERSPPTGNDGPRWIQFCGE